MTKVSIALATFNGERFLDDQLSSLLGQTRQPDELIVCDDCSTDSTMDILEKFSQSAPFPVKIFQNKTNLGFIKNFENSLEKSQGDVIFLCDQDDVWLCEKISKVLSVFEQRSDAFVVINDQLVSDQRLRCGQATVLTNARMLGYPDSWYVQGCCTALRKCWFDLLRPLPNDIDGHDIWLSGLADLLGTRVILEEPLQLYRRHDSTVTDIETHTIKRVSRFSLFMKYGLGDARKGWAIDMARNNLFRAKISDERKRFEEFVPRFKVDSAIDRLDKSCSRLSRRIEICSTSRVLRWALVCNFWFQGEYAGFSGWRSALKDLVRPY